MLGGHRMLGAVVLGLATVGCAASYNAAINKLDAAWKESNDRTLEREGRRRFEATRPQAFAAAQASVRRLGMVVEQQDLQTGFLLVTAPAPVPLSGAEWAAVQETETPKMRTILGEDLGVLSAFAKLDPSNRDIVANVFVADRDGGVEVSVSFRIGDRNPASSRAKRLQAPPAAVSIGVRKFYAMFEEELRSIVRAAPAGPGSGRAAGTAPEVREVGRETGAHLARAQELALQAQAALRNNQYATALPLALDSLAIREEVLGPAHLEAANSLSILGEVYRGQGKWIDAERLHRRALEIRERQLGREHPDVAETLSYMGMLYNAQGSLGEAESLLKRALFILEKGGEGDKPSYRLRATVLENLAKVYRGLGRSAEADEAQARAALLWVLE